MAKIDRFVLRQRIQTLEGLTDDERAALLELAATKRYGLVWEEREEEVEERLREELPVLVEDTSLRLIGQDNKHELPRIDHELVTGDSRIIHGNSCPNHILIEGDNLEALTTLSYTHEGKVDVIYIDPPYNTGNKDFVYNDSFVDSEDSYRHSKWLSFMSKRLRIAKRLLSDRGVIFISIDDNEQANLKLLCDEVFGEKNFVGQWQWFKSATPPALSLKIKKNIEYVIAYEKSRTNIRYQGVQKTSSSNDPITKPQNSFKELMFPKGTLNIKLPDGVVTKGTYGTAKFPNELLNDMIVKHGKNDNDVTFRNRFIWLQTTLDEEIKKNTVFDVSKQLVISYKRANYNPEVPPNLIDISVGVDTTEEAGKQLLEIMGENVFDYPKPVSLIKYLLSFLPSSTVLDFFSGSGTTLHAVMQLNKEDGGKRQCILVTNNENNICRDVTYERNKRVIEGYTTPKGVAVEGLKENNLRYYRTQLLPRERTNRNMRALVNASTDLLCIKENIYNELKIEGIAPRYARMFGEGEKCMLVVYDERVIPHVVDWIGTQAPSPAASIRIYVFSPGAYAWDDDFAEVIDRVELCALPEAIYQAYKNVLPKKKVRRVMAEGASTDVDKNE